MKICDIYDCENEAKAQVEVWCAEHAEHIIIDLCHLHLTKVKIVIEEMCK